MSSEETSAEDRKTKRLLALAFAGLFAVVVGVLLFKAVPDQNRELVSTALGFIAGWVSGTMGFYFGSNAGAELKNETINRQAKMADAALAAQPPSDHAGDTKPPKS